MGNKIILSIPQLQMRSMSSCKEVSTIDHSSNSTAVRVHPTYLRFIYMTDMSRRLNLVITAQGLQTSPVRLGPMLLSRLNADAKDCCT